MLLAISLKGTERLVKQGKATQGSEEKDFSPVCFYCKKSGHEISECEAPG